MSFAASTEEVTEIRGRRVQGVGFGNIFGSGPINLRSTAAIPVKRDIATPDADHDKVREAARVSEPAKPVNFPRSSVSHSNNHEL